MATFNRTKRSMQQHQEHSWRRSQYSKEQEVEEEEVVVEGGKEEEVKKGREECARTGKTMHLQNQLGMLRHKNHELQAALEHLWEQFELAQVQHEQTLVRAQQEHERAKSEFTATIEKEYLETKSRLRATVDQRLDSARATVERIEGQNQELRRILRQVQRHSVVQAHELWSDLRCLHLALDAAWTRLIQPTMIAVGVVDGDHQQPSYGQQQQAAAAAAAAAAVATMATTKNSTGKDGSNAIEPKMTEAHPADQDLRDDVVEHGDDDDNPTGEKAVPGEKERPTSIAGLACYELLEKVQEGARQVLQRTREQQQMCADLHSGCGLSSLVGATEHHHRRHHLSHPYYHHHHHQHQHQHQHHQHPPLLHHHHPRQHHRRKSSFCSHSSQATTATNTLVPSAHSSSLSLFSSPTSISSSTHSCILLPAPVFPSSSSSPSSSHHHARTKPAPPPPSPQDHQDHDPHHGHDHHYDDHGHSSSPTAVAPNTTTTTTTMTMMTTAPPVPAPSAAAACYTMMQEKRECWYGKALHHLQKRYSRTLRAQTVQHERDLELVKQQCVGFYREALHRVRAEIRGQIENQEREHLRIQEERRQRRRVEKEKEKEREREKLEKQQERQQERQDGQEGQDRHERQDKQEKQEQQQQEQPQQEQPQQQQQQQQQYQKHQQYSYSSHVSQRRAASRLRVRGDNRECVRVS
ncbi:hypothetical protein DFQ26_000487 [Actinomortierella ambigua]|nr:hypothetical protein DFQ26_000487 [Actinomortierella ambigua]